VHLENLFINVLLEIELDNNNNVDMDEILIITNRLTSRRISAINIFEDEMLKSKSYEQSIMRYCCLCVAFNNNKILPINTLVNPSSLNRSIGNPD
jgi:fructose-bisphosphate aldolase class 1